MKNLFIGILSLVLLSFTACTQENVSSSKTTLSTNETTGIVSTTTESRSTHSTFPVETEKGAIYNGKIQLNMKKEDVFVALATKNITINNEVAGFSTPGVTLQPQEDGSLYWVEKDIYCYYTTDGVVLQFQNNILLAIEISAASNLFLESGLKINDPLSKMIELYGMCEVIIEKRPGESEDDNTYLVYYQYTIENGYLQVYPIESVDGYTVYTIRLTTEKAISLPNVDGIMERENEHLGIN